MIKLQDGGKAWNYVEQRKRNPASSTEVAKPKALTIQQAEENKAASARRQYVERMKIRQQAEDLKRKGQTKLGNTVNDMGTNMLTQFTQFRTPTNEELEKGRGGWSGRGELLGSAVTHGLINEMTGGAMNWIGNKIASGEAKSLVKEGINKIKNIDPNKVPLVKDIHKINPLAFKPKADNYYRVVGTDAADDMLTNGVVRSKVEAKGSEKATGINLGSRPTAYPSFSKGKPSMEYAASLPKHAIIETNRPMAVSTLGRHGKGTTIFPVDEAGNYMKEFPANEAKLLTPDWLRGYKPLSLRTGNEVQTSIKDPLDLLANGINKIARKIDDHLLYPIRNYKEIPLIKKRFNELLSENNSAESINRMNNLGINADAFNKIVPKITVKSERSKYIVSQDRINIDADQLRRFKKTEPTLTMDAVIDHEIGHRYQSFHNPSMTNTFRVKGGEDYSLDKLERRTTNIDYNAKYIDPRRDLTGAAKENAEYFYDHQSEPISHMMETRRGMIERGYLSDRHAPINVPTIRKYFKDNPTDRIATFINPKGKFNFTRLRDLMNKLPAAAPIAGAAYLQNKKANPE